MVKLSIHNYLKSFCKLQVSEREEYIDLKK